MRFPVDNIHVPVTELQVAQFRLPILISVSIPKIGRFAFQIFVTKIMANLLVRTGPAALRIEPVIMPENTLKLPWSIRFYWYGGRPRSNLDRLARHDFSNGNLKCKHLRTRSWEWTPKSV